jgi:hypothetical protein
LRNRSSVSSLDFTQVLDDAIREALDAILLAVVADFSTKDLQAPTSRVELVLGSDQGE